MRMKAGTAIKKQEAKGTVGRPSYKDKALLDNILNRLSNGESLNSICKDPGFPAVGTIHLWRRRHPEFNEKFQEARRCQVEARLDQAFDICDDAEMHSAEKKVRIDTYRWFASKIVNDFKDKVEVTHKGDEELVDRLEKARLRIESFNNQENDDEPSTPGVSS